MRKIIYRNVFEKDVKRAGKRGLDIEKLKSVIRLLAEGKPLALKYRDHALVGNYRGHRECHIQPDWLLIYKTDEVSLILERTGTHADLFKM